MAYPDYNTLAEGTNFVQWLMIINSWVGGYLFGGVLIIGFLITIFIARQARIDMATSLSANGFIWAIISTLAWTINWNGYILVPTSIPVLLAVICAVGVTIKAFQGIFK